jgi:hypothetical protein
VFAPVPDVRLETRRFTEWDNLDAAPQLVRAALVGWLAAQHNTGDTEH